jgi:hypothetical protein
MWGCELWNQSHECRWADRHLKAARIAVLANPADVTLTETQLREVEAAAGAMALRIQIHNADTGKEIDAAFETIDRERPDAVFIATTPFLKADASSLLNWRPQVSCGPTPHQFIRSPRRRAGGLRAARRCRVSWRS